MNNMDFFIFWPENFKWDGASLGVPKLKYESTWPQRLKYKISNRISKLCSGNRFYSWPPILEVTICLGNHQYCHRGCLQYLQNTVINLLSMSLCYSLLAFVCSFTFSTVNGSSKWKIAVVYHKEKIFCTTICPRMSKEKWHVMLCIMKF